MTLRAAAKLNLMMFNLAVDREHVTLAFGLKWIEELASRVDHIDVVTMAAGQYDLPGNVSIWSLGTERGYPKFLRLLLFYWIVIRILCARRIDVVFTHMIPIFAVLFWPVAKVARLRNVMWYAHKSVTPVLRLAHRSVDAVVASTPEGFRIPSGKATFIGQGINTDIFAFRARSPEATFRLVTVGRIAPSKGLDLLLDALSAWNAVSWQLTVVGDGADQSEQAYAARLRDRAFTLLGEKRVTFTGRLDPPKIAERLASADLFINLSETGSLDKAIVEAMASGCPVVSSNDAFRALAERGGFAIAIVEPDVQAIRSGLDRMIEIGESGRQSLAELQSALALGEHALPGFIDRLTGIIVKHSRRAGTAT